MSDLMTKARRIQQLALEKKVKEYENWIRDQNQRDNSAGVNTHSNWPVVVHKGDQVWNSFAANVGWIPGAYQPFTKPDPGGFDTLAQTMADIENNLGSRTIGKINTVRGTVEKWTGDAAYSFRTYSEGWDQVTLHQASIAGTLGRAAKDMKALYAAVDKNVNIIADKTIVSLESIDHSGGKEWAQGLAIAGGVVATAVGFVASGGTGGVLLGVLAASGDGLSLAAGLIKPGEEKAKLGGHTVDEILANMTAALNQVVKDIGDAEKTVITAISAVHQAADNYPGEFCIKAPGELVGLRAGRGANDGFIPPGTL